MNEVTLELIAAKVKHFKEMPDCSTILFLGAGASKTAGIPVAEEIIQHLESNEPWKDYINCKNVTRGYTTYMDCLSSMERKRLLKGWIEKAKINATHLYAAQLVYEGYVDCIVTTNFDPLILKSLALFNIQPAIYDLAISKSIVTSGFDHPAVIYFHGQSHGFWQLNTKHELALPANVIKNAIDKISQTRAWIVVGYGGNDPLLDHLSSIDNFGYGLYWVGYDDNLPSQNVIDKLLNVDTKEAFYLKGYDADSFFRALKNEFKLSDPMIIDKPFSYLLEAIENILPFKIEDKSFDPCEQTRVWIKRAIDIFEEQKEYKETELTKERITDETLLKRIKEIYSNDKFEDLLTIQNELGSSKDEEIIKYHSYVYNSWGNKLSDLAFEKEGEEAYKLFYESFDKYRVAVEIKKDLHEAYYNWGNALSDLAKKKEGDEANRLWLEGVEKCLRVEEIKKGAGAYNIACFYSLLKDAENSIKWFETALLNGNTTREHIEKDTDLDFIRTDPRYTELLNKYRPVK